MAIEIKLIKILTHGYEILVNPDNIVTARAAAIEDGYIGYIDLVDGRKLKIDLEDEPYDSADEALEAIWDELMYAGSDEGNEDGEDGEDMPGEDE